MKANIKLAQPDRIASPESITIIAERVLFLVPFQNTNKGNIPIQKWKSGISAKGMKGLMLSSEL